MLGAIDTNCKVEIRSSKQYDKGQMNYLEVLKRNRTSNKMEIYKNERINNPAYPSFSQEKEKSRIIMSSL